MGMKFNFPFKSVVCDGITLAVQLSLVQYLYSVCVFQNILMGKSGQRAVFQALCCLYHTHRLFVQ